MADYTTTAAVKQQLSIGTSIDDALIALYVTQASQMIDTECLRTFSSSVGTRLYDAAYPVIDNNILYFPDDYQDVYSVWNGANGTLDPTAYRLLPLFESPKYALQLLQRSNLVWQVGSDGFSQQAIGVAGTLGYCLTGQQPADITMAATKLAAWLYQNRDNEGSTVQIANGAIAIPASAPTFVLRTINKYVRRVAVSDLGYR